MHFNHFTVINQMRESHTFCGSHWKTEFSAYICHKIADSNICLHLCKFACKNETVTLHFCYVLVMFAFRYQFSFNLNQIRVIFELFTYWNWGWGL